jgi:nuclear GTP-binding protein
MKKLAKKQSKRVTTRQRIKAEKKVREYNRKLKKEKRKNPGKFAKSKKDPGIPNACPFKEKVLHEVEEAKQQKIEEKLKRRERLKLLRKEAKNKAVQDKRANVRSADFLSFGFIGETEAGS